MKPFYRAIFSLSLISPLIVLFALLYAEDIFGCFVGWIPCINVLDLGVEGKQIIVVALVAVIIVLLNWWIKHKILSLRLERSSVDKTIYIKKRLGMNSLADYLPYILLFIFPQNSFSGIVGTAIAFLLILSIAFFSPAISYSPILDIFGLHFYEIETVDGETLLILTDKRKISLRKTLSVYKISDECFLF